jgi:hypothetical protein
MVITLKKVEPNLKSINYELIFVFNIVINDYYYLPFFISGELFSEDGLKVGDLIDQGGNLNFHLNAKNADRDRRNNKGFDFVLTIQLTTKAINHIESIRLKKETSKDIVFKAVLKIKTLESNICISHLHLGDQYKNVVDSNYIFYKYTNPTEVSPARTNLWTLSGDGSPNILNINSFIASPVEIKIDLMTWINDFKKYLNLGEYLVLEFLKPDEIIFSPSIRKRYVKAQNAIKDMEKQLSYGEWKAAVIMCRPVVELFNHFEDFKKLLIDVGYSEEAYEDLRLSIYKFFELLSKFYHGLKKGNIDVNPEIPVNKEDAYLAYSFSVSLLYLISQKLKRKEIA